ncbi:hypothetical protein MKW92_027889 [Papaver armeniacum]|nr:hypothetical protein MKW92_027889 [Papaver armeniacum]
MSLELIGGALLGAVVSELMKAVLHAKTKATNFKPNLEKLTITLKSVVTKVEEIKRLDDEERMRTDGQKGLDLNRLIMLLREGKILVEKCSAVRSWNLLSKNKYSGKIEEFDNDLIRFFQLDAQVAILLDVKMILGMVKQLTTERENGSSSNNGSGARNGDGGVNDLKAAVPIKSKMMMTSSVPQIGGSAKANEKLDRQFERAAPIKLRDHDLKAAVRIITSADPQKVGSAEASEKLDRHSESAPPIKRIKPRDGDLKSAVPIKPAIIMTSADPQKVASAEASEKLDRHSKSAAPIKYKPFPRHRDLKVAVPIKPAIILTLADPQKLGSAKASEELDSQSESAAPIEQIKPYVRVLNAAAVPITSADRQKNIIGALGITACTRSVNDVVAALEVLSFRDDESVPWYSKSFGGLAKTSLSEGLDLRYLLNGHFEKIETPRSSRSTDYEPPWIVSLTTHSSETLCKAAQLAVLTRFRSYGPLGIYYNYDTVRTKYHRHMELVESVRHENVVPLRAYCLEFRPVPDDQPLCLNVRIVLVYDYCKKGSVHEMLHGKVKVLFDWDTRLRAAIGVARGIAFIHRQDNGTFFHGSIKSENIFLNAGNYGCISELGRCLAGYREPYVEGGYSLREFDVHNYGVLLLELVTGIYPYYGIVKEFKTCIGSRGQLLNKVEYFIRLKKLNSEELCFQLLDPELVKRCGELKKQLVEMLWIAWDCVAYEAPSMDNVLKRVERIDPSYIQFKTVF